VQNQICSIPVARSIATAQVRAHLPDVDAVTIGSPPPVFCVPPADASTQAAPRLELLRRRGSIEQFGIVRRLHAFEISWRKRRG
jgi:hypothetical protein